MDVQPGFYDVDGSGTVLVVWVCHWVNTACQSTVQFVDSDVRAGGPLRVDGFKPRSFAQEVRMKRQRQIR